MTKEQMEVHKDYDDMAKRIAKKWRTYGFLSEKDRQRLLLALNCMRMVCDSTYILDQKTRHDTKINELMSILEEAFEEPDQKVVIFSQWERMTRLVAQELEARNIKYENLNGSIPSEKRKGLFDNFNNDPDSRVFLSTDAGGVGLNLQAASLLINLDIPWNPAVLEQRIARIYRLGQKKNVNIINLVSIGSFEHKMLDVLKFKSSLAGGILDNGEDIIFMGDSQFKQFMKSVDAIIDTEVDSGVATPMPVAVEEDTVEEKSMNKKEIPGKNKNSYQPIDLMEQEDLPKKETKDAEHQKGNVSATPASELLTAGMDFFGKLAKTFSDKDATENFISSITEKDKTTGKTFVKIPVEDEKMVENAVNLLSGFLKAFQK
jgi:superfamily II DNA/RNA helicase